MKIIQAKYILRAYRQKAFKIICCLTITKQLLFLMGKGVGEKGKGGRKKIGLFLANCQEYKKV